MDKNTDFEDGHKETIRAFVTLFKRAGDKFQFEKDEYTEDFEKIKPNLTIGSDSTIITIISINNEQKFKNIKQTIEGMNIKIIEENESHSEHDTIGKFTAYTLAAKAVKTEVKDENWNVPHLIVHGSLSPEITNSIKTTFGSRHDYYDIQNHFVLCGKDLDSSVKTELEHTINETSEIDEDKKRRILSSVRNSSLI